MNNTTSSLHEQTIGEIAAELPIAIRVFEAWKIDYCCGGKQTLSEACTAVGKSVEEFAAAVDSAVAMPDSLATDWSSESLRTLSGHIVDAYHRYTREELATFAPLAAKVLGVHGERRPELPEVVELVRDLTTDMLPHMLKEEQVLFPYVAQLEEAAESGGPPPTPFFGTVKNPIRMMMLEHDRVGELLGRLRVVTDDYTPPESACFSYRELYRRLTEFELRTHEHIHIENNVYFTRAVSLEERSGSPEEFAFSHACGSSSGS
ncbi:MAG TPA: iron-sulfur cluster repair di-iron protein [Thermoanaerobaculia bacterium]|nr:iron-sulfur cluster repair di-iron protein [Thermoanaerobaculia bacterium]